MTADPTYATDSILDTIKRSLDIATDDNSFDTVLILHINSVLSDLYQLGLGAYGSDEKELFSDEELWADFFEGQKNLNMIKSYVNLRLRLLFDPPQAGFTTNSFQSQIDKMEWRIKMAASSSPNTEYVAPPGVDDAYVYNLTGGKDFPEDAPIGAPGIDSDTGIVWRKS